MDKFLPDKYKVPQTSNYLKLTEGEHTFRIVSSAIVGYVYFTQDNKPVRSREDFEEAPTDIKQGGKIKEFWAFIIWNVKLEKLQIMEVTQKTIMQQILSLIKNPKWGDVKSFDINITKTGKSLETSYSVVPEPKTPVNETAKFQYDLGGIDLEKLYDGDNPFTNQ